ncbi:SLC13 family permease [candidate division KSB1 bacterium]
MNEKFIVLLIFILVYLYLIFFKKHRAIAIWIGLIVLLFLSILDVFEAITAVNWNVIGIFAGTLVIAEFFSLSGVPAYLADGIVERSSSTGTAMLRVCAISGVLSAFVENVAVVLIIAPIALEMVRKLKVSPVPVLIGLAVSSNLQGTATLIGDPPSMILAAAMKMDFIDFIWYQGRPGIFFAVEFSAVVSLLILYMFFKKYRHPVEMHRSSRVESWTPTLLLTGMIIGLAVAPAIDKEFLWLSGTICMVFAIITVLWGIKKDKEETKLIIKRYDFDTTFFLAGIFVLVYTFESAGLIDDFKNYLVGFLGESILINFLFIVVFSVIISAFIDNVPYITVMIPVAKSLSDTLIGSEFLLVFALLIGACMGGNITPIGASANIVSAGILKKEGYPISFWDFIKIGLPFTIGATAAGALFIWIVWS